MFFNRGKTLQSTKIGDLNVIVEKATHPAKIGVLILHGYGADFSDLAGLRSMLDPQHEADWYFPNGILSVHIGPYMTGRAWFQIDAEAIEKSMQMGLHRDFKSIRPDGIDFAIERIMPLYNQLRDKYDKLIIGGFSQGAMLTTDLCMVAEKKPEALIIMSGAYLDAESWNAKMHAVAPICFFQSHGNQDPLLSFDDARLLNKKLNQQGWQGEFVGFDGGHEIPGTVLEELKQFLQPFFQFN